MNQGSVARQRLYLLVAHYQTPNRLRQINQQTRVTHVVLRDLSLVTSLLEIFSGARTENWQSYHSIAAHDSAVLD